MASSPITSRQIEGEKVETVTDFIFLGSKITVSCVCSHEIKRCLLVHWENLEGMGGEGGGRGDWDGEHM